jgi:hypothetical protein
MRPTHQAHPWKLTRTREMILLVAIAFIGLSVSVRADQIHRALAPSGPGPSVASQSSLTAKTDVSAPALVAPDPYIRLLGHIVPPPQKISVPVPPLTVLQTSSTESLWYSVAVKHRPPPDNLA